MANITKPTFENLWAESGERTQPDAAKLRSGWGAEIPPRQVENWIQNRQDQALAYLYQKGIPEWDPNTDYRASVSIVQHNGAIYRCLVTSTQQTPSPSSGDWEKAALIEADLKQGAFRDVNSSGNNLVDNTRIRQSTGQSQTDIMSQKAVTDALTRAVPTGTIMMFGANNAPDGFLICDGRAVSRTTYANLFNIIGTTFGEGNGTSTFNIPDLRDQFVRGASVERPVGSREQDQIRSHNHSATTSSAGNHTHSASTGSAGNHNHSGNTGNAGNHNHSITVNSGGSHTHSGSTNSAGNHTHTRGSMNITGNFRGSTRTGFGASSGAFSADTPGMREISSGDASTRIPNRVTFNASRNWTGSTSSNGAHSHSVTINSGGSHSHSASASNAGNHNHSFTTNSAGGHVHTVSVGNSGDHTHTVSVGNTGGDETRPKNVALHYIIKT